jgi:uncharacterized protein (TIGR02145 family)
MAENLNFATASGSWCKSNADNSGLSGLTATSTYCDTYGRVYDWATATATTTCPSGWHLPTDAEWQTMEVSLGMTSAAAAATGWRGTDQGSQLKSASTLWNSGGIIGTTKSGFSVLPAGYFGGGSFSYFGYYAGFWTATANGTSGVWYRYLGYNYATVSRGNHSMTIGFSVRCLKDSN